MSTDRLETDSEAGLTLVELLVYSLLLVLVISVVGGILISSLTTEKTVRSVTSATTAGQLVADSVESGIRNASAVRLTVPSGTDQLLLARTIKAGTTLTWTCAAWYYSAATPGEIRYKESASAITSPNASTLATWTLLDSGVSPAVGSTTIFAVSGTRVTLSFRALAGNDPPVAISSSAVSRTGSTESAPCF